MRGRESGLSCSKCVRELVQSESVRVQVDRKTRAYIDVFEVGIRAQAAQQCAGFAHGLRENRPLDCTAGTSRNCSVCVAKSNASSLHFAAGARLRVFDFALAPAQCENLQLSPRVHFPFWKS
mmetsp:Transcript_24807/g.58931  ORF Transcript_24807/g.58931 Transcript_24807/m.58931 type:complete len:122 (-) Transcript_24807:19-384(-)|eukprot:3926138-Rhodomonas_salina.1